MLETTKTTKTTKTKMKVTKKPSVTTVARKVAKSRVSPAKFEFRVKFWSLEKLQKTLRTTKNASEKTLIKTEIQRKKSA
jgi:hypothetical protein